MGYESGGIAGEALLPRPGEGFVLVDFFLCISLALVGGLLFLSFAWYCSGKTMGLGPAAGVLETPRDDVVLMMRAI